MYKIKNNKKTDKKKWTGNGSINDGRRMINKSISALKNANKNKEIVLVRFTQNATGCIMNKHTGLGKIGDLLTLFIKLKK